MRMSRGNIKLGDDTLVLNITSAKDCPSERLGLCNICAICYAKKAERQYPTVLPFRRMQAVEFDAESAEVIANGVRAEVVRSRSARCKKTPIKFLRFSESGDFKNQWDVNKLSRVAELLRGVVVVYGYTARRDLRFTGLSKNMVVNGSGFMVDNMFSPVKKHTKTNYNCAGDCRGCGLCKTNSHKTIEVLLH